MTRVTRSPWTTTTGPHGVCTADACGWQRLTGGSESETTALYRVARAHATETGHTIQISRGQFCTVAPAIDLAAALIQRMSAPAPAAGQKDQQAIPPPFPTELLDGPRG